MRHRNTYRKIRKLQEQSMSPIEYGRASGQHEQRQQQAMLLPEDSRRSNVDRSSTEQSGALWKSPESQSARSERRLSTVPTRIEVYGGCKHPGGPTDDWLRDSIDAMFTHADRIQIDSWSYPDEMDEREPTAEERAEYAREVAQGL